MKDSIPCRFCVSIEIYDNQTKKDVVNFGSNCVKEYLVDELKKAIKTVEEFE